MNTLFRIAEFIIMPINWVWLTFVIPLLPSTSRFKQPVKRPEPTVSVGDILGPTVDRMVDEDFRNRR